MALKPPEIRQCGKCGAIVLAGDDGADLIADMAMLVGPAVVAVMLQPDRMLVEGKRRENGSWKWIRFVHRPSPGLAYLAEHWCAGRRLRLKETLPLVAPGPPPALATPSLPLAGRLPTDAHAWSQGPSPTLTTPSNAATPAAHHPSSSARTDSLAPLAAEQASPGQLDRPGPDGAAVDERWRSRDPLKICCECRQWIEPGQDVFSLDVPGHAMYTAHCDAEDCATAPQPLMTYVPAKRR